MTNKTPVIWKFVFSSSENTAMHAEEQTITRIIEYDFWLFTVQEEELVHAEL